MTRSKTILKPGLGEPFAHKGEIQSLKNSQKLEKKKKKTTRDSVTPKDKSGSNLSPLRNPHSPATVKGQIPGYAGVRGGGGGRGR